MINEKYIQALILGSVIGFAIVIDDFIGPKPDHKIMQEHIRVKDAKNFNWKENYIKLPGSEAKDDKYMCNSYRDGPVVVVA